MPVNTGEKLSQAGVAISTTGDPHRLELLANSVEMWTRALPDGSPVLVTVDGNADALHRVQSRLGRMAIRCQTGRPERNGKQGVAVNKNTGLEWLMRSRDGNGRRIEHLFLSDDDTWPKGVDGPIQHITLFDRGILHSMVCWGRYRFDARKQGWVQWSWPRGSAMYVHRSVVEEVGGFIEEFGPGGHEHVEWSRRIHQAGFTPAPYCSPLEHALFGAFGAREFWHAEDMARPGEPGGTLISRRRELTTLVRLDGDVEHQERILNARDGDTSFVPYTAVGNGRVSATMYNAALGQGAGES